MNRGRFPEASGRVFPDEPGQTGDLVNWSPYFAVLAFSKYHWASPTYTARLKCRQAGDWGCKIGTGFSGVLMTVRVANFV